MVITGGFCVRSTFETEPLFPLLAGALVTSRKDGFPGSAGFATGSTPPANCGASVESTVTVPGCGELVPEIFTNWWSVVLNGYASVQIVPSGVKLRPIARPGVAYTDTTGVGDSGLLMRQRLLALWHGDVTKRSPLMGSVAIPVAHDIAPASVRARMTWASAVEISTTSPLPPNPHHCRAT